MINAIIQLTKKTFKVPVHKIGKTFKDTDLMKSEKAWARFCENKIRENTKTFSKPRVCIAEPNYEVRTN